MPHQKRHTSPIPRMAAIDSDEPWPVRAFVVTWNELDGWWRHFEVDDLVRQLSDAEVEMFLRVVDATSHFAEQLRRSEEHTSELQSLMRISYAVFCLKKKNN